MVRGPGRYFIGATRPPLPGPESTRGAALPRPSPQRAEFSAAFLAAPASILMIEDRKAPKPKKWHFDVCAWGREPIPVCLCVLRPHTRFTHFTSLTFLISKDSQAKLSAFRMADQSQHLYRNPWFR